MRESQRFISVTALIYGTFYSSFTRYTEIEFPEEHLWQGSHYLVNKTFNSLREMFTSTKLIQDWLTDCARLVALVCAQNMEWVTPVGLPVVQPYQKNFQTINGSRPAQHFLTDLYSCVEQFLLLCSLFRTLLLKSLSLSSILLLLFLITFCTMIMTILIIFNSNEISLYTFD